MSELHFVSSVFVNKSKDRGMADERRRRKIKEEHEKDDDGGGFTGEKRQRHTPRCRGYTSCSRILLAKFCEFHVAERRWVRLF